MKITPLEIRQKSFEKVFRGYDKDEVTAFLQVLSDEWIKSNDEKKSLEIKLESAEKEISKLREVESSLYKTLKTAEDTGANMIEQANKAAELQLKETKLKTDNLLREAKAKATMIAENSEKRAKEIIGRMLTEIKTLENNFNAALNLKENLIADLTNLSSATLERAQKFKKQKDKLDIEKYIKEAREFAENYDLKNIKFGATNVGEASDEDRAQFSIRFQKPEKPEKPVKIEKPERSEVSEQQDSSEKSFFDLLE
jgi:cell division initiation protein